MSIETVNVGSTPNDGTGDTARAAFTKINENFTAPENAASKVVATNAQAIAGTAGVLPDAAGVAAFVRQYGVGVTSAPVISDANLAVISGFFQGIGSNGVNFAGTQGQFGTLIVTRRSTIVQQINIFLNSIMAFRSSSDAGSTWNDWRLIYHTGNTTVDGNGFIKQASPIVQLHSDHIVKNGDFEADFERVDTGHYLIKNTLGFAQSGWWIETPKDANGNIKVFVECEDNDGDITVKTYEPDYSTGRATAGEPADIPAGRWIDLRLHEAPVEQDDLQTDTMAQTD